MSPPATTPGSKKTRIASNNCKTELYNTQILSPLSDTYRVFVPERILTGEETSLVNAFIGFCHTTLAHNQPDRFYLDEVQGAFQHQPGMTRRFLNLF
jgi:glutamate dehydrogenase